MPRRLIFATHLADKEEFLEQICPSYKTTLEVMSGSAGANRRNISDNVGSNAIISSSLSSQVARIGLSTNAESDAEDDSTETETEGPSQKTLRTKNLQGKRKRGANKPPQAAEILEALMDRQVASDKTNIDENLELAREKNEIDRERALTDKQRAHVDEQRARLELMRFEVSKHATAASTWKDSHEVLGKWFERLRAADPELSTAAALQMAEDIVYKHPLPTMVSDRFSDAEGSRKRRRGNYRRSPTAPFAEGATLQLSSPLPSPM